ncbi:MAG: formate C-acetyltransferase/glycerol dehydratase family glycyl radical enzyme, partial [Planctomycetes bacterium]|nr:formate C-acetyltransferase/glycerol dehydratase family glycyl radical enzyme [Planctomycetota bacterium]
LGAMPDGRRKGQPISENMSPSPGAATEGLTSLFRSLARLPFKRVCSGPLNVRITPKLVKGADGLANLAAALRTYFAAGGLQVQLSFVSVDELRAAQAHPEAYRDLMVRITGYSAVFVDMSRPAQEEIIARTEMMV